MYICIWTTYMDRANTNMMVFDTATHYVYGHVDMARAHGHGHAPPQVLPIGSYLSKAAQRLFGHVVRQERADPMWQATFTSPDLDITNKTQLRVGRPRLNWVKQQFETTWNNWEEKRGRRYTGSITQRRQIQAHLQTRPL